MLLGSSLSPLLSPTCPVLAPSLRHALPTEGKWLPAVLEVDGHGSKFGGKKKALLSPKLAHIGSK